MADPSSGSPSGSSTPNLRFASQSHTAEDVLKEQTYGLVHLSDFRKRRAEAQELASLDGTPTASGAATPDGRDPASKPAFKKRKKVVKKGGLSFGGDDEEQEQDGTSAAATPTVPSRSATPAQTGSAAPTDSEDITDGTIVKKRLKPNTSVTFQPKVMTKSALLRENQLKEQLRKEYTQLQEAVKQTVFVIPFTFFDGKTSTGGMCRMKKGDHIWLFLERARKVGADMAAQGDRTKKDWARIGVDDLMIVRGDLIVPHHYDFHYFLLNRTVGYNQKPIFSYSAEPTPATPQHLLSSNKNSEATTPQPEPEASAQLLSTAATRKQAALSAIPDTELEGYDDDPSFTKVVDRRWYERNKHIYPASLWEDFDPARDYNKGVRKDGEGNALFYSRR